MKEYKILGNQDTRSGFGEGLVEAGKENANVVALCADLAGSVRMDLFKKEFPERYIECGIAEANMVSIASGMALSGKVPFVGSFAAFVFTFIALMTITDKRGYERVLALLMLVPIANLVVLGILAWKPKLQ